ncbi:TetR family transcriptional regulator [Gemmobacter lanyuensis]
MQELARAAGMSVGNFYRYFPPRLRWSRRSSAAI